MLKTSFKASAVILALSSLTSFAAAEQLPKQSRDFKANYNIAINDNKAKPETAYCSATAKDLAKSKNYKYDRFGFTQAEYDAVTLKRSADNNSTTVTLNGNARQRVAGVQWDDIMVECTISKNKVRSIFVTVKK